ncbi:MAG: hypothetical protein HY078_05505 [Elusimicrobia bacterium]|nr:hypothetical protein [Elusimicrobiota bacterium]
MNLRIAALVAAVLPSAAWAVLPRTEALVLPRAEKVTVQRTADAGAPQPWDAFKIDFDKAAEAPTRADFIGLRSGRLVHPDDRGNVYPAIMYGKEFDDTAAPGAKFLKILAHFETDGGPARFDTVTAADLAELIAGAAEAWPLVAKADIGARETTYSFQVMGAPAQATIRKAGETLYLRVVLPGTERLEVYANFTKRLTTN